jgi:hypothetical protein
MTGREGFVARDIRAAGGVELFWRASRRVATAVGRIRARFPAGALSDHAIKACLADARAASSPDAWSVHLASRRAPFFFSPSDRPLYQPLLQRIAPDDRADRIRAGAVLLYGRPQHLGAPPDWHRDPLSEVRWPMAHWSRVSLGGGGDVRNVWEMSRHRDLFVLGRAYWRTGDRTYADAAAVRLGSWLDANPPEMGINWWSNLEVSMRAQAWVWALHWFAGALDAALVWQLTGAIISSARHIAADLPFTRRTMPGNHVIGDAAGLATIALALPELREAPRWRDRAVALLESEAASQVLPDGTHDELSPAYHAFVWELLFQVMTLAARSGIDMPRTREALGRMARALALVSMTDGEVPPLGDSDEAVGWDLGDGRRRVGAIAALSGLQDLKGLADVEAEELLWFRDTASIPEAQIPTPKFQIPTPKPQLPGSNLGVGDWKLELDAGAKRAVTGFGVCARSDWSKDADWCLLRHGGLSKHTHADALNLLVSIRGVPCLIDAGTGSYNASPAWRRFFRGTAAHNTVQVDGLDQAEAHRTFRWSGDLSSTARVVWENDRDVFLSGEHDGFARIGVQHARRVLWLRAFGWIVVDRLEGTGAHLVELRWLMPEDAAPTPCGARLHVGGVLAELAVLSPGSVTARRAVERPAAGWTSEQYGQRRPALSICAGGSMSLPCSLVSVLAPLNTPAESLAVSRADDDPERVSIRAAAGARSIAVTIERNGWSHLPA